MPCQLLQGGTGASLPQRPIPSSGCCLLLAAGAFDRNDLLFMRQEEDKRRFAEIEQEEQERLAVSWQGGTMQPASSCVGRPACKLLRMGSHGCEIAAALMEQQRLLWRAARLAYKPCNPFLRCGLLCTYSSPRPAICFVQFMAARAKAEEEEEARRLAAIKAAAAEDAARRRREEADRCVHMSSPVLLVQSVPSGQRQLLASAFDFLLAT